MDRNFASTRNSFTPNLEHFAEVGDHSLLGYQSTIEIATTKNDAGVIL